MWKKEKKKKKKTWHASTKLFWCRLTGTASDVSYGPLWNCWLSLQWSDPPESLNIMTVTCVSLPSRPCVYLSHAFSLSEPHCLCYPCVQAHLCFSSLLTLTAWPWLVTCWMFACSLPVFVCLTLSDLKSWPAASGITGIKSLFPEFWYLRSVFLWNLDTHSWPALHNHKL